MTSGDSRQSLVQCLCGSWYFSPQSLSIEGPSSKGHTSLHGASRASGHAVTGSTVMKFEAMIPSVPDFGDFKLDDVKAVALDTVQKRSKVGRAGLAGCQRRFLKVCCGSAELEASE